MYYYYYFFSKYVYILLLRSYEDYFELCKEKYIHIMTEDGKQPSTRHCRHRARISHVTIQIATSLAFSVNTLLSKSLASLARSLARFQCEQGLRLV